ncbi:hypothetical protein K0M31_003631 [Melipona bicolor]|uniref:Secreted protein n=1 Tax=Melipona bicolor TaxID=60889 RepID=A0AA40G088_9HYME|nr:hypothetical protein K0M31_003631 [Melipona bicolor]
MSLNPIFCTVLRLTCVFEYIASGSSNNYMVISRWLTNANYHNDPCNKPQNRRITRILCDRHEPPIVHAAGEQPIHIDDRSRPTHTCLRQAARNRALYVTRDPEGAAERRHRRAKKRKRSAGREEGIAPTVDH